MAVDAILKLGDLEGESQLKGHEGEIQVESWQWGLTQAGTTHLGTGGGAGKVNVSDLTIVHAIDKATPAIINAVCVGAHFKEGTLTLRKAGTTPLDYLVVTLEDIIVTSYSPSGTNGEEQTFASFSLNFARFELSYQPQDNKGAKAGGAVTVEYDIAAVA